MKSLIWLDNFDVDYLRKMRRNFNPLEGREHPRSVPHKHVTEWNLQVGSPLSPIIFFWYQWWMLIFLGITSRLGGRCNFHLCLIVSFYDYWIAVDWRVQQTVLSHVWIHHLVFFYVGRGHWLQFAFPEVQYQALFLLNWPRNVLTRHYAQSSFARQTLSKVGKSPQTLSTFHTL